MTGLLLALLPPQAALAVTCINAGLGVDSLGTDQQYGVRIGRNLIVNPSGTVCSVVRSAYIVRNWDNFVEVGYYEDGPDWPPDPCTNVTTPHILVYAIVDRFIKCKAGTSGLTAGQEYSFRVDNPDHDFDFVHYWDDDTTPSISLGFYATDHKSGFPQVVSERATTADSLRGEFHEVNSLGGGGSWNWFGDALSFSNGNVGNWNICSWGPSHLDVRLNC